MANHRIETLFMAVAALVMMAAAAFGQDQRNVTVHFPAGSSGTSFNEQIIGNQSVAYIIGARAGQVMDVSLSTGNGAVYFNIYAPGSGPGGEALAVSEMIGPMVPDINKFSGALPQDGNYTIVVYMVRAAARRNEKAQYSLSISIPPKAAAIHSAPAGGDFADGLAGGPDYWQVFGVAAGDQLNLRDAPTTHSQVIARLGNGAVVSNRGCKMEGRQRWCRVESADSPGMQGWVNGHYLRESANASGGAPLPQAGDALVEDMPYNATGMVRCVINGSQVASECHFGVLRFGNGSADIVINRPDGVSHTIHMVNGEAVAYDRNQPGQGGFSGKRIEDFVIVTIGTDRYEFPDAIAFGG